jgi:hypothetical protein
MAKLLGFPEATFVALERIRETALIRYDSLFTPERKLWSLENLRQFRTFFVGQFDKGEGSFLEKWKKQLEGASDDILQLAAELLYVQQFFTKVTGPETKLENVKTVLAWCTQPVLIPEWASDGSHIKPAFRRPDIREVSNPFALGSGRFGATRIHRLCMRDK